jgi:hypothetical protein
VNSIELRLIDLVRSGEAPVYSTYRWLVAQVGQEIPLRTFLPLLDRLLKADLLRLWKIDSETQARDRLFEMPPKMEQLYLKTGHDDKTFDPFGLSLTIGQVVSSEFVPEWSVDFDLESERFVLTTTPDAVNTAWREIEKIFPDLTFAEDAHRRVHRGVQIEGSVK